MFRFAEEFLTPVFKEDNNRSKVLMQIFRWASRRYPVRNASAGDIGKGGV